MHSMQLLSRVLFPVWGMFPEFAYRMSYKIGGDKKQLLGCMSVFSGLVDVCAILCNVPNAKSLSLQIII